MSSLSPYYYASNDAMFKLIFGDNRDVEPLAAFLQAALDLPAEDLSEITVIDPTLSPDHPEGKLGILDVRAKTGTGKMVDIEIQLCNHTALHERIMFYLARMVSDQVGSGDHYKEIKQSICIVITDFVLVPGSEAYHNCFTLYDPETGTELTRLVVVRTLELSKLPKTSDGTLLWLWLKFIAARNKEELKELTMLADKNPPVLKAVGKLAVLNEDERARLIADSQNKLRWDIAAVTRDAEARGRMEGRMEGRAEGQTEGRTEASLTIARNMLQRNIPIDEIAAMTELSEKEILSLIH